MTRGSIGFLVVAPWAITGHGGVNGVIRNLVAQLQHDGRVAPIVLQHSWSHRRAVWNTMDGVSTASMRLRSLVPNDAQMLSVRTRVAYLVTFPVLAWSLIRILKRHRVCAINIHYPAMSALTFVWLKQLGLFRGQLILSFHGSDVRWGLALTGARARVWRTLLKHADSIVCVSHQLAQALASKFPLVRDKSTVIHNGVDFLQFQPTGHDQSVLRGAPTVISVASFDRVKGVDVLVRAIPSVVLDFPGTKFLLVGESGTEDTALLQLAADLGVGASIEWHRNVPHTDIPRLMAQADLFVLPSRDEALGLALLEAGACALPAIATRVGGVPEIIHDGHTGVLIAPEDPAALAYAMVHLLMDRKLATRLGCALQRSVRERFTWEAVRDQYIGLALAL